jgi:hypothetical protein
MRASTLEKTKVEVLKPKALAYDVDPLEDYMRPGNNPAETAFQLLRCGLEMLITMADEAFPTLDSKTRKKAPKYLRQGLFYYGEPGAVIMGQTVPLLYTKVNGRLSGDEPPELAVERHRALYETVISFYPFKRAGESVGDQCLREFTMMETHEVPEEVRDGTIRANAYAQALMNGENPDENPELLGMQREHAIDYFIEKATTSAIKFSLPPNDRKLLKSKFTRFQGIEDPDTAMEYRKRLRSGWIVATQHYLDYALLDA